jgi:hypothetical protein
VAVQGLVECIKHLETFTAGEASRSSVAVATAVSAMARPINSFAASIIDAASTSLEVSEPDSCNMFQSILTALDQLAAESVCCCSSPLTPVDRGTTTSASGAAGEIQELAGDKIRLQTALCSVAAVKSVPAVELHPALLLHAAGQQLVAALSKQHNRLILAARAIADEAAAALADLSNVIAETAPAHAVPFEAAL